MDLTFTDEQLAFRDEVRAFLDRNLTSELREAARATTTVFAEYDLGMAWHRLLDKKGWLAYRWPVEHGGTGWGPVEGYIYEKECALAGAPALSPLGLKLLGPVLHRFGTEEQQTRYLRKILSGEHYWCQGFSEPGAGSDLASLKTRAVRQGDHYVINGSKLWTTHAHFADHMFCLVRTDLESKAQRGISFMLIDMNQPGVEVKPILGLAGDHEVNAVFLDNVMVPACDLIGTEGQGWTIAKFLLENERGGSCYAPGLLADIARVRRRAESESTGNGEARVHNTMFAMKLARLELEAQALEVTEMRNLCELARGNTPNQTSLVKLIASSLRQEVDSLAMESFSYSGLQLSAVRLSTRSGDPETYCSGAAQVSVRAYLNSLACTIFGGTDEIQRTIIAKTILGL